MELRGTQSLWGADGGLKKMFPLRLQCCEKAIIGHLMLPSTRNSVYVTSDVSFFFLTLVDCVVCKCRAQGCDLIFHSANEKKSQDSLVRPAAPGRKKKSMRDG